MHYNAIACRTQTFFQGLGLLLLRPPFNYVGSGSLTFGKGASPRPLGPSAPSRHNSDTASLTTHPARSKLASSTRIEAFKSIHCPLQNDLVRNSLWRQQAVNRGCSTFKEEAKWLIPRHVRSAAGLQHVTSISAGQRTLGFLRQQSTKYYCARQNTIQSVVFFATHWYVPLGT